MLFYTNIINIIVTVTWHSWSARRRLAIWPSWVASHPPRSRHSRAAVAPCPIWFVLLKVSFRWTWQFHMPSCSRCGDAKPLATWMSPTSLRLRSMGQSTSGFQRSLFQKALVQLYWMLLFFNNCFQHHFSSFCSSPSLSLSLFCNIKKIRNKLCWTR